MVEHLINKKIQLKALNNKTTISYLNQLTSHLSELIQVSVLAMVNNLYRVSSSNRQA